MPREIVNSSAENPVRPGRATDIYCCGILLLALALPDGEKPEELVDDLRIYAKKIRDGELIDRPHQLDDRDLAEQFWDLLRSMTQLDELRRPQASAVLGALMHLFP